MQEEKLLYKIRVTGRVQGVGFRWSAAREAGKREIKGIIKNLSDGSVYIEAEGSKVQLLLFADWCKTGPAFCSVESVSTENAELVNYTDFRIVS